jgi:hypothetical protein
VILYWILEDADFASNVGGCLNVIERELNMTHEEVKSRNHSYETCIWGDEMDMILFVCAIILIDGVAKKAEKFMETDDIQQCLERFPRVYIQ